MLANLLTGLRLALVLPVALAFAVPGSLSAVALLGLLALAVATDIADGRAARHFGTASARGMLFDHATDFLFVTSALAALAYAGVISALLPALIAVAFTQYVLDSYLLHRQKSLRMSVLGRWNGVFYFVPLFLFAASFTASSTLSASNELGDTITAITGQLGIGITWLLTLSTLASIADRALAPRQPSHG
ncbi:MAG: CDP-alcohol phosphatidyltransferase family protein [Gammaproteobacteria bacterium]|jgi:phosphatidylglycerophosphate synthase|nr:CDP-alcohol phosphatidyltransferase family protein [Gammaproteobacteria bacterium]